MNLKNEKYNKFSLVKEMLETGGIVKNLDIEKILESHAVHGVEEIMDSNEAVVIVNPFKEEEKKFTEVLIKGVGLKVNAISSKETSFPTMVIPEYSDFTNYIEMAAGWNLLIEVGVNIGINLDKPTRARKIGNEFIN